MTMPKEVDDFRRGLQESFDLQRDKVVKRLERMTINFKRAIEADGMDRVDNTSDVTTPILVKDDEEEESDTQATDCVYNKIFDELSRPTHEHRDD
jgi:hypothetical protein